VEYGRQKSVFAGKERKTTKKKRHFDVIKKLFYMFVFDNFFFSHHSSLSTAHTARPF
jgi:hypothetical protein